MAQNSDLIEIVATAADTGCGCSASEFAGDFIAKTSGTFITSLSSTGNNSTWAYSGDTATFSLGTLTSTDVGTLTVQGQTDADAIVYVKSADSTTTITPTNVSAETLTISGAATTAALTVSGNLEPSADSTDGSDGLYLGATGKRWRKVWTRDLDVEGTFTIGTISLSGDLTVAGATTLNGAVTLGNADADSIIAKGTVTTTGPVTLGSSGKALVIGQTGGTTTLGVNLDASAKSITNLSDVSSATAHVTTAPTATNDVVRYTDVNINSGASATLSLPQVTVTNGFITAVTQGTTSNLIVHAGKHKSTTRTATSSADGSDPLHSYEIGAVERANPVVSQPLRITKTADHTYGSSVVKPYFVIIGKDESIPSAANSIEGQILFRKRDE